MPKDLSTAGEVSEEMNGSNESIHVSQGQMQTKITDFTPIEEQTKPLNEGGLAGWSTVLGGFFALFSTFGWLNSLGLFQTYYEETLLTSYSASEISWIFTAQLFLMFSGGAFFGQVLETYGILYVAIPCTILVTLCVALLSLCTEYYQIFLTQGVGFGIGAAGLFTCAVISTGQWFQKRRALALGIVAAGSSTGGVIHPIYLRILISSLGFPSAVRWSSLILGIATTLSCVLMRTRLPRKKWDRNAPFFDVTLFKQPIFSLYCLGSFFVTWGLFAPWNYLPSMALRHGFSRDLSIYTIVVLNAASIPGRIIPSYLADAFGRFNSISIISILTALSILCFWLPVELLPATHIQIFLFGAVYGFCSGAWISLCMPVVAELGSMKKLGQRFGMYQVILGVASLTGLPIQGALIPQDSGGFGHLILFSGVSVLVGTVGICGSRLLKDGSGWRG